MGFVHTSIGIVSANRPCRATASPAHSEPRCGLPARPGKDLINDGLFRRSELELLQQVPRSNFARLPTIASTPRARSKV